MYHTNITTSRQGTELTHHKCNDRRFYELEKGFDFVVIEVGGSTGDIENLPFLYAAREVGRELKAMT